jgi:hypothetical protein
VFTSATGILPFYAVSFTAEGLRVPIISISAIGTTGRNTRFTAMIFFPEPLR